jgi:hypothetical protein
MPHPFLSADNVAGVGEADFYPRRAAIVPEMRMIRCKRAYVRGPEGVGAAAQPPQLDSLVTLSFAFWPHREDVIPV